MDNLFSATPPAIAIARRKGSISERFDAFSAAHPEVYQALCKYARQVKAAGRARYGIASIFERVRWHMAFERDGDEPFKLNNDYRALYARLIMAQEEDLVGFFETRGRRAE